jgi:pimeloyl-ACP methyl ester carboxylesterase
MNVIIPGFAVTKELFSDFIKNIDDVVCLDNSSNTYKEINDKLNDISKDETEINLFGWSMGSLFALKWTIDNPGKIRSIFLTGATARFCEKPGYENGIQQKKLEQMIRMIKIKPEIVMNDFYKTILDKVPQNSKYLEILIGNMPDKNILLNGLNELGSIDLLNDVDKIDIPVYIFQGKSDVITPLKGAEILDGLLKHSTLKAIDGGHSLFLENPKLCADEWKDFLCTTR